MLHTVELNMAKLVNASDINIFLANAAWAICYPPYSIKNLTRCSKFERDILFEIPFIAD